MRFLRSNDRQAEEKKMMSTIPPNMADYDALCRGFRLDVPERFNFTMDVMEKWAEDRSRVALHVANADGSDIQQFTFAQLSAMANQFAQALLGAGIRKGDAVLVMLPRGHEWYVTMLALFKTGIIAIPTTPQCTSRDVLFRLTRSGAPAIVTDAENAHKVDEAAAQAPSLKVKVLVAAAAGRTVPPHAGGWVEFREALARESTSFAPAEKTRSSDPMMCYFTSGTVAYPKMVVHSQASLGIGHDVTARYWHDLKPADLHWTVTDTGWAKAGWGAMFGQWRIGARIFVHSESRFDVHTTLRLLGSSGVTTFCAAPTVFRLFAHEDLSRFKFPALRHCTSAGEPLNPEIIRIWQKATGIYIYDGYGQTETASVLCNYRCLPIKPGSMGKPAPGFTVSVLDDEGNELPPGEEGEIAIRLGQYRPVGLFHGFWRDEDATRDALGGEWYRTGDKARKDEDGYFWFIGRKDDVIITAGYRIGPFEVESALQEHPAVLESAAVASPDPDRGEVVKAFVRLKKGFQPSEELVKELQQHCRTVTAPYKYPRKIEFVTDLPKTVSGKIRRGELKAREFGKAKP
jgi:acyl-coenzyme A synthetase/AMP-(fatty) acid ligase